MQVTGQIKTIAARDTRAGTFYDVVLQDGKKYGAGMYAPRGIKEGDFVSFEVEVKKNGQYTNYDIRRGTIRLEEGEPEVQEKPEPAQRKWGGKKESYSGGNGFDQRQETISKQAALNTALSFANLASANGAVPMPKSVKEADKLGILYQWVLETAAGLYKLSTGNVWDIPTASPVVPQKPAAPAKKASKAAPEADFAEDDIPFDDAGYDEYPDENE